MGNKRDDSETHWNNNIPHYLRLSFHRYVATAFFCFVFNCYHLATTIFH